MEKKREISTEEDRRVGATLGVDWSRVELEQFRRGLEVELEHGASDPQTNVTDDDLLLTGKIAWAHLKEAGLLHAAGPDGGGSGRPLRPTGSSRPLGLPRRVMPLAAPAQPPL